MTTTEYWKIRYRALRNAIQDAPEKHPLSHDNAEDGRYAWPDRWAYVTNALKETEKI